MAPEDLNAQILRLLRRNARMSATEMAARLDVTAEAVAEAVAQMETNSTIMGYSAVINADRLPEQEVRAIIEVEVQPQRDGGFDNVAMRISKFPEVHSVYLVSGRYDLRLEVVGTSLQDIGSFVASKLASQEGVKATATHFLLKKYKEAGVKLQEDEQYERLKVVP
ncbi:MAG: Lrp/AsnC family transcriptional regulator [Lentisphaeria bacterium]|nr:Lrp/AsnC family transcriptional regulator [Lentisphaeria bacterium]